MADQQYKAVNIEADISGLGIFCDGNLVWEITSLIRHAEDQGLEVFDLPLCGINLSVAVWEVGDMKIKDFAKHWKKAADVNLDYPIILDDDGFIMDGWHRVAKALFLELPTIKAIRFDKTPPCTYVKSE